MKNKPLKIDAREKGFSMVMILFTLVAMTILASASFRALAMRNQSVAIEVLSARTFLAAESGAQAAMMRVFPTSGTGACNNFSQNLSQSGFYQCTVNVTCNAVAVAPYTLYSISSSANCQSGAQQASRRVDVRARSL